MVKRMPFPRVGPRSVLLQSISGRRTPVEDGVTSLAIERVRMMGAYGGEPGGCARNRAAGCDRAWLGSMVGRGFFLGGAQDQTRRPWRRSRRGHRFADVVGEGPGHRRCSILADGELVEGPDGRLWHLVHVPLFWAPEQPTWKADRSSPQWDQLKAATGLCTHGDHLDYSKRICARKSSNAACDC